MNRIVLSVRRLAWVVGTVTMLLCAQCSQKETGSTLPKGDPDNGKLALPDGFEAIVVADSVGRARHLAVNDNGDIYVKLRGITKEGGSAVLRDSTGDGKADIIKYFGTYKDPASYGTAMRIYNGYLYVTTTHTVYRNKLIAGEMLPDTTTEAIVIDDYKSRSYGVEHIAKPIAFDDKGHIYVPFGAPGDVCQVENRTPGSPGKFPCPELEHHGGVWQFDANKVGQLQADGKHYATGIRSLVAMEWNHEDGNLFAIQHGRDDFYRTWPDLYSAYQSALLPSEEFFRVTEGMNGGWPYYYFDQMQNKKLLNPEYGGDGKSKADGADTVAMPLIGFPGHFAPNDLLFYKGDQFPDRYKNGAFIAFHGSTIRAPYPQAGYIVAFVPFSQGKPSGPWEVFADGFAQTDTIVNTSDAKARPMGLSVGPDGSLYITESVKGKIWRVMYKGKKEEFSDQQLAGMTARMQRTNVKNPDELKDNLLKGKISPGAEAYTRYCATCHLPSGQGDGNRFPPLFGSEWVSGNKQRLIEVVLKGMSGPITVRKKQYDGVMPAHAFLSDEQIADILTHIRTRLNHGGTPISSEEVQMVRGQMGN